MAKDFTDYLVWVFDSGERVRHVHHVRQKNGLLWNPAKCWKPQANGKTLLAYPIKDHTYRLELDRAYLAIGSGWSSFWRKIDMRHPLRSLTELIRSKKIGVLFYQEPPPPKKELIMLDAACSCGFKGESMKTTKAHVTYNTNQKREGHELKATYEEKLIGKTDGSISPMHISKIRQPSGRLAE